MNNSNIEKASDTAVKYSKISNLADLRKEFKSAPEEHSPYGDHHVAMCSMPRIMKMSAMPKMESEPAAYAMCDVPIISHDPVDSPAAEESYTIGKSEISYAQSERLVQKALNRYK